MNEINIKDLSKNQLLDLQQQITKQLKKKEPVTQEQFNELFFKLWKEKCTKYNFMKSFNTKSDTPTSIIEFTDDNGEWMVQINYDVKNPYFYVRYNLFWSIFGTELGVNYNETQTFMDNIVEEHFKLREVTPLYPSVWQRHTVEEHFKLRGVTPRGYGWNLLPTVEEHFKLREVTPELETGRS